MVLSDSRARKIRELFGAGSVGQLALIMSSLFIFTHIVPPLSSTELFRLNRPTIMQLVIVVAITAVFRKLFAAIVLFCAYVTPFIMGIRIFVLCYQTYSTAPEFYGPYDQSNNVHFAISMILFVIVIILMIFNIVQLIKERCKKSVDFSR